MEWIKTMFAKKMALLGSLRFWTVTLAWAADYAADLSVTGFIWADLFTQLGLWLGTVALIGTMDKWPRAMAGCKKK